jgi:hypothetical protein
MLKQMGYKVFRRLYRAIRGERAYRRWVFSRIYQRQLWRSNQGGKFHSGAGSRGEPAQIYVEKMGAILRKIQSELSRPITIVDLGCGDFEVARDLLAEVADARYIGCDIVPDLVAYNTETFATGGISFQLLDIIADPLPTGDIYLVRQVLQHLSNAQIRAFLDKLPDAYVFITEGQPLHRSGPTNPDKEAGDSVRFDWFTGTGSGVELDKPPFNACVEAMFSALIPQHELIMTFQLFPAGREDAGTVGGGDACFVQAAE